MSSSGPEYEQMITDFKRGGWITGLFGLAGQLAYLLVSNKHHPAIIWLKRLAASTLVGWIAYFALWGADIPGVYKSIILATTGMACTHVIEIVMNTYGAKAYETRKYKKNKRK